MYRQSGMSVHFYAGVVYLLIFYVLFLIIQKNFCVEKWLNDLLTDCKKMILFVALSECSILYFLLTMNWGYIENRELIISFGVISGIALILLFVLARFWAKSIYTEKNILEVRNNVIASQYEELNESYKKYRCLISTGYSSYSTSIRRNALWAVISSSATTAAISSP